MFKNYHIDGNKEMIAIGVMNIAGSCTSCYLTTGMYAYMLVSDTDFIALVIGLKS